MRARVAGTLDEEDAISSIRKLCNWSNGRGRGERLSAHLAKVHNIFGPEAGRRASTKCNRFVFIES